MLGAFTNLLSGRYEPLWNEYGVDLLLFGHVHAYERTNPVANYTADSTGCAPTYITIGEHLPLLEPLREACLALDRAAVSTSDDGCVHEPRLGPRVSQHCARNVHQPRSTMFGLGRAHYCGSPLCGDPQSH
jgi:hypothetical protein